MNKDNNGFLPCPFCGQSDKVSVLGKQSFYDLQGEHGTAAMLVQCYRCNVMVWEDTSSEQNYERRVDILRRKWNKRAAVSQETKEGEKQ